MALHRVLAPKPDYLRGRIGLLREGPIGQRRLCSGCFGSTAMSRSERARHRRGNRRRCRGLRRALRLRCARLDGHRRLGGVRRRRRARPISRRRVIQDGRHGSRALVRPGSKVRGRFRPGFRCGSEGCGRFRCGFLRRFERRRDRLRRRGCDRLDRAGRRLRPRTGRRFEGVREERSRSGIGERCGCAFRCGPRRRPGCGSRRGFGLVRLRNGRHREAERGPGDHFQKPQVRLTRIQRRAGHRFGIGYRLRRRRCCRVCGAGLRFRGGRSPLHSSRRRVGGFRLRIDGLRRRSRTIPRAFRCFASSRLMRMLGKPVHEREQALQRQRIVVVLQHPLAFSRPRRSARCCAADRSEARLSNRAIGRHQPPTIANKP